MIFRSQPVALHVKHRDSDPWGSDADKRDRQADGNYPRSYALSGLRPLALWWFP